ncbi:hypothetical protein AcW1_004038 [Taiwanofungus camphoratus]|nr:hypothetical protein AcV7_007758 [Antrodia cinnamomea]KAI0959112.1 hypothetical protein AcW1_004038 [Antrodia cinnamomea]
MLKAQNLVILWRGAPTPQGTYLEPTSFTPLLRMLVNTQSDLFLYNVSTAITTDKTSYKYVSSGLNSTHKALACLRGHSRLRELNSLGCPTYLHRIMGIIQHAIPCVRMNWSA